MLPSIQFIMLSFLPHRRMVKIWRNHAFCRCGFWPWAWLGRIVKIFGMFVIWPGDLLFVPDFDHWTMGSKPASCFHLSSLYRLLSFHRRVGETMLFEHHLDTLWRFLGCSVVGLDTSHWALIMLPSIQFIPVSFLVKIGETMLCVDVVCRLKHDLDAVWRFLRMLGIWLGDYSFCPGGWSLIHGC